MRVSPDERDRIVQEYARRRMQAEIRKRGDKAALARALEISPTHIGDIVGDLPQKLPTKNPGRDMIEKLAKRWGFGSYAALEAQALVEAGHYPVAPEPVKSSFPELSAALAFLLGERPMDFLLAARREAEGFGMDRPRRDWLAWLDAKWWEWQRARSAAPAIDTAREEPPLPHIKRAKPKTHGSGGKTG